MTQTETIKKRKAKRHIISENMKEEFIDVCRKSNGYKTPIRKHFKCCLNTVNKRLNDWPEAQQAMEETVEEFGDFVENKLAKQVKEDNLTAIIFTLKTKFKHRGYSERSEITGADGSPLQIEGTGFAGLLKATEGLGKEDGS